MRRSLFPMFVLGALALGGVACNKQQPGPQVASSASETNYAVDYPQELDRTSAGFATRQDELKTDDGHLDAYADGLKDPRSLAIAVDVVEAADAAGKSEAYVERTRELEGVNRFFDEEGNDIANKVAGAANYSAKQSKCDVMPGGAAAGALKPAVGKQVEKRLRARNEAFAIIERNKPSLPKSDVDALEKLADEVARASYVANVELVEHKERIRDLAAEGEQVKKTLDASIADEKAWQAEPGRTDADKKASNDRIDAMNKSKAQVDATVQKATDMDKDKALDKQVQDAQKAHQDTIDALEKKLKAKAKDAQANAPAAKS